MASLEIDGRQVTVADGSNLIQAAERLGIEIPHYCYHPGLPVAGNCRMCLVEIEKFPKLQIACNTRAADGMVVRTRSERVKRAQAAVLKFLLINHPIDCPVCDQAGECKLQDYYMDYDRQPSRVPLEAKVKKGKAIDIGPLVMLDQERCILCTRCTRFLDEVTKTSELGIFQRGSHCEINLFPGRRLENPYSGNVVDICPVGALTSKDFRFRARVWYLEATRSVCPTCATGCNIDIHHRRGEIFRLRPRFNPEVNGYWMCDEGRLSYKSFQGEGRLLQALIRRGEMWERQAADDVGRLVVDRLRRIREQFGGDAVRGVVGAQATCEEAFLFQRLVGAVLGGTVAGFRWSPSNAYHDDFLIDADRNPNTKGLQALGISMDGVEGLIGDVAAGRVRALVLLHADLGRVMSTGDLELLGNGVEFVVVLDTRHHAVAEWAAAVLPLAAFAETPGTVVNRKRRAQLLREAFAPPGDARPGWRLLRDMLTYAGEDAPLTAGGVLEQIAATVPAFGGLSYQTIGHLGAPLRGE